MDFPLESGEANTCVSLQITILISFACGKKARTFPSGNELAVVLEVGRRQILIPAQKSPVR